MSALPLTVHSRAQVARFLPLQTTDLQKILKQQASLEETKDDPTWLAQAGARQYHQCRKMERT